MNWLFGLTDTVKAYIGGGLLAAVVALSIALYLTRDTLADVKRDLTVERERSARLQSDIRAKTAEATAADLAHARAVETAQNRATQEVSNAFNAQLAAARARADAMAARLRLQPETHSGGSGNADLSAATDPARDAAGARPDTLVDDLRICADNTVKAAAWRDWWRAVEAVPR